MIFSKKKNLKTNQANLYLNGKNIHQSSSLKILGILFDRTLTWNKHIAELKRQCHQRLNLIKSIASTKWGADSQILIDTYRALIRSKLDYGSTLYQFASNHHLKKLDSIQTTALRISLGAYRTSPRLSILAEAGEVPLDLRRTQLTLNFSTTAPSIIPEMFQIPLKSQPQTAPKNVEIRSFVTNYTSNSELQNIILSNSKPLSAPPWTLTSDFIDLSIYDLSFGKSNTPETLYRNLFQEKACQLSQSTKIFTDGSIYNESRGCAIIVNDDIYRFKLPNSFSIFSCEAFAILESLNLITKLNLVNVAIFSDSKSVIEALKKFQLYRQHYPAMPVQNNQPKQTEQRKNNLDPFTRKNNRQRTSGQRS